MKSISTFRLTFHVSHPSISASEIESVFRLPIRFSQSVGMQKKAKSGKTLDGVYKRTNVSFSLHEKPLNFDDVSIVDFMLTKLNLYDSEYIKMICKSEGSCHFLIGIFSSSNVMFEFGANTIKRLSTLNVGVKFDFYGGED